MKFMAQFQEKKRPSGFVIPSLRSRASSERSEGSLSGERSFAALRMTMLNRLRLTRKTSYVKCVAPCGQGSPGDFLPGEFTDPYATTLFGGGMGRPNSFATIIQLSMASCPCSECSPG